MKIELDTNNPGDMQLVQLIATVIAAEGRKEDEYSAILDEPIGMTPVEPETTEDGPEESEEPGVTEELDSEGQPWNPELHASTKTKTSDGRWKKRRGVAKVETTEEPKEEPKSETVTEADFIVALTEHRGKFGIDRTKEVTAEAVGIEVADLKIGELTAANWPGVVAALKDDKGPKNVVSLEDF